MRCYKNGKICDCCESEVTDIKDSISALIDVCLKQCSLIAEELDSKSTEDQERALLLYAVYFLLGQIDASKKIQSKITSHLD